MSDNPFRLESLERIRNRLKLDYATQDKALAVDDVNYLLETVLPDYAATIAGLEALVRELVDAYALEAGEGGEEAPDGLLYRARLAIGATRQDGG